MFVFLLLYPLPSPTKNENCGTLMKLYTGMMPLNYHLNIVYFNFPPPIKSKYRRYELLRWEQRSALNVAAPSWSAARPSKSTELRYSYITNIPMKCCKRHSVSDW
jgi:hypothetical protein